MSLEWVHDRYGEGQTAHLGVALSIYVGRRIGTRYGPPPKYYVRVFGAELKREFDEAGEAIKSAERVAKKWLAEAIAKIS